MRAVDGAGCRGWARRPCAAPAQAALRPRSGCERSAVAALGRARLGPSQASHWLSSLQAWLDPVQLHHPPRPTSFASRPPLSALRNPLLQVSKASRRCQTPFPGHIPSLGNDGPPWAAWGSILAFSARSLPPSLSRLSPRPPTSRTMSIERGKVLPSGQRGLLAEAHGT